ncbi:hypothetical protein FOL47_004443 [Perkinsus chesapeaki]|uniref:C3H1-type domain-containing protein n=1 Tax=Perkinsus chesapeaki TaxID=330153 RepID=A0A7J6M2R9_PERCH|nr:hypothetical protein FOL47_004443 [Perkinsus chesapeaki]
MQQVFSTAACSAMYNRYGDPSLASPLQIEINHGGSICRASNYCVRELKESKITRFGLRTSQRMQELILGFCPVLSLSSHLNLISTNSASKSSTMELNISEPAIYRGAKSTPFKSSTYHEDPREAVSTDTGHGLTPELVRNYGDFHQGAYHDGAFDGEEGAADQPSGVHKRHFYKTSMCKFYLSGNCVKGDMCTHAHQEAELVKKPEIPRTRLCRALLTYGFCNYGQCKYAHDIKEIRQTNTFFKTKICDFFANGHCKLGNRCRFAHSEEELVGDLPPPGTCDGTTPKPRPPQAGDSSGTFPQPKEQRKLNSEAQEFCPRLPTAGTKKGSFDGEIPPANQYNVGNYSRKYSLASSTGRDMASPMNDLSLPSVAPDGNIGFLTARMVSPDGTPLANGPLVIPTFAQHQQQPVANSGSPVDFPGPPLPLHLMQSPLNAGAWGSSGATPTFHLGANRTPTHIHDLLRSASIDELKRYANQVYED